MLMSCEARSWPITLASRAANGRRGRRGEKVRPALHVLWISGIRTVVFHAKLVQIQLLGTGLALSAICGREQERRLPWITKGGSIYTNMFFILDFRISTDDSLLAH